VSVTQAISFLLFSALGGSAADRFDRRRLLLLTQSLMMGFAVALSGLAAAGVIRFWMILLMTFASSAVLSIDQPTRNTLLTSLVPKESLMNAVSLQTVVFNGASILGPALGGLVLHRIGYSGCFLLNATSYFAVLAVLLLLRTPSPPGAVGSSRATLLQSSQEAVRYIRRDPVLPSVVTAYGALLFLGPSLALTLPLFDQQVLHEGPV
jgi:MFS family permease